MITFGMPFILLIFASLAAGMVNAVAGGGTLLTFPAIMAVGISALAANATNALTVSPGFIGAVFAQRKDLALYRHQLWRYVMMSILGGLTGGILLLILGEQVFVFLVPFLLLAACLMLAFQDSIRKFVFQSSRAEPSHKAKEAWSLVAVGITAVYGGYFGAGMGVILLAILGLTQEGSLKEINALKQTIALTTNLAASLLFIFAGKIVWPIFLVMSVGTITGGYLGGRLAGWIRPNALRWTVVVIGGIMSVVYFVRIF
jgi:uncharacterized protein